MDWTEQIDAYCERMGPGLWAEPVNAVTNAAFLVAALVMWRRTGGPRHGQGLARALCLILACVGLGSLAFHTTAQVWSAALDSLFIVVFALVYLYAANRHYLAFGPWLSALGAALYIPFTSLLTPVFAALPFFEVSSFYWPLPVLMAAYAVVLHTRLPEVAAGLAVSAGLLSLSLTARSLDMALCADFALGTHFLWHVLNALLLGWMIEVLSRHLGKGEGRG